MYKIQWIIEKIFDLAVHGTGAAKITRLLIEERVPTVGWLNFQRDGTFANIYAGAPKEKSYVWTIAQVKSISKEARKLFNIKPGDKLLILGDEDRGLAIIHQDDMIKFVGNMGVVTKE